MAPGRRFVESLRMIKVCLIGSNVAKEQALLKSQPEIDVHRVEVGEFDDMLKQIAKVNPAILVLSDVDSDLDADELCFHTYLKKPNIKTLIITEDEAGYDRLEATGFSCKGFMLHQQRHAVVRAVRVVHDGEAWLSRKLVTTVLDQLASKALDGLPPLQKVNGH